jgi:light-regulated signal transduction histidine kinase (bacteriophytochrome)
LREAVADNPEQQQNLRQLETQTDALLEHLRTGIAIRREQGEEASRRFFSQGSGKREMDRARQIVADMERIENHLMEVRSAKAAGSFTTAMFSIFAAAAISLGMVLVASVLAVRELRATQQARQILERVQVELEERVRERTFELTRTNSALERSNQELEQFASVASHDLQEPLRKIQAFGDRLATKFGEQLGEDGRDYVERMQRSAARMRTLINDLLSFSRVSTQAQPFSHCELGTIARDVVGDLERRIEETGARVEIGALPALEADPLQMRQLLQNLIANALKFHRGGVEPVIVVGAEIIIPPLPDARSPNEAARPQIPVCQISIQDNGVGFEEIYLDRIFDVFQRLHGRQDYEGTGMGLAICRKIAERHGGSITARSIAGEGSTFIVTLPVRQSNGMIS